MISLNNQETEFLYRWLNVPLHGELLRSRNKFIEFIKSQHEDTQEKRVEWLKELSDKDEKGEPIIENGVFKTSPENLDKFSKKFNDLLSNGSEDYDVPRDIARDVKEILMTKMTKGLDIEEGRVFEGIIEELDML